jgi:hypothetical protein
MELTREGMFSFLRSVKQTSSTQGNLFYILYRTSKLRNTGALAGELGQQYLQEKTKTDSRWQGAVQGNDAKRK